MKKLQKLSCIALLAAGIFGTAQAAGERILVISGAENTGNATDGALNYLKTTATTQDYQIYDLAGNLMNTADATWVGSTIDGNWSSLSNVKQLDGYDAVLIITTNDDFTLQLPILQAGIDQLRSRSFVFLFDTWSGANVTNMNSMLTWTQARMDVAPPGTMAVTGGDQNLTYNLSASASGLGFDQSGQATFITYVSKDVANIPTANILYENPTIPANASMFYFPADVGVSAVGHVQSCIIMANDVSGFGDPAIAGGTAALDIQVPNLYENILYSATNPNSICRLPESNVAITKTAATLDTPYHSDMITAPTLAWNVTMENVAGSPDDSRWTYFEDTLPLGARAAIPLTAMIIDVTGGATLDAANECTVTQIGTTPDFQDKIRCGFENLAIGATVTFKVNATLDTATSVFTPAPAVMPSFSNTGINNSSSVEIAANLTNNTSAVAIDTLAVVTGDLSASATSTPASYIYSGQALSVPVMLTLTNNSANDVFNPQLVYTVPTGGTVVPPSGCIFASPTLTCSIATIVATGTADFAITIDFTENNWIPADAAWTQTIDLNPVASFGDGDDAAVYRNTDLDITVDTATTVTLNAAVVALSVASTATPAAPILYNADPYTAGTLDVVVTNTNANAIDLINATISIEIPAETTPTPPAGCVFTAPNLVCTIASLLADGSTTLSIPLSIDLAPTDATWTQAQTFTSSATSTGNAAIFNSDSVVATSVMSFNAAVVDLSVTSTLTPAGPILYDTDPYTAGVLDVVATNTNANAIDLINAVITIAIPAETTPTPPAGCVFTAPDLVCTIASLLAGGSTTLSVPLSIDLAPTSATWTQTQAFTSSTTSTGSAIIFNSNVTPAGSSIDFMPVLADISINGTLTLDPADGAQANLAVTVANAGPNAAAEVIAEFDIPADLTVVKAPAGCTVSGTVYSCNLGAMAMSASRKLNFVVRKADPGAITVGSIAAQAYIPATVIAFDPNTNATGLSLSGTAVSGSALNIVAAGFSWPASFGLAKPIPSTSWLALVVMILSLSALVRRRIQK